MIPNTSSQSPFLIFQIDSSVCQLFIYFILCVRAFCLYIHTYTSSVPDAQGGQKTVDALELALGGFDSPHGF